jgi:hypothetical protein
VAGVPVECGLPEPSGSGPLASGAGREGTHQP